MSRNGRIPINIPENTQVRVENGVIFAKGKLGELSFSFNKDAKVEVSEKNIMVNKGGETRHHKQMWGTVRTRIYNIIKGVSVGYAKELVLNGVGYKAAQKGDVLELLLGYSHPINFEIPKDLKVEVPKPTEIKISGTDKQRVGQIAANIRSSENLNHIKEKV